MYPRFSETFVVSEILAREAAGERIEIFSLRPSNDQRFHPELARVQAPVTYVDRLQKTSDLWESLRTAEAAGLGGAICRCFPDLVQAQPDDAVQAVGLALELRQRNIRHLHAHFASVATSVARLASRLSGVPFSFTAHAVDIFHESVSPDDLRTKLEQAHHAVTISTFNVNYLRGRFPAASGRLHLVRNGLELSRFEYRDPRPVNGTVRVVGIGRLVEKKGFHDLLLAARTLESRGIPVDLSIAGTGILAEELQKAIDRLGLSGHARLLGPRTQDQVKELLRSADVFAAPSVVGPDGNADGLPTVLLEAMALGVPCIGTAVTGIPEVLRNRRTGILARPGSPEALAEAICEISGRHVNRVAMARSARSLIEREYDSRRQAEELRALSMAERKAA
ncbi:MAG: glycosyltransferase family 4 protein [Actinomycetota bacterium]|nr:glycosyltransferase family 4 protein [Actinomycetota bacterium]